MRCDRNDEWHEYRWRHEADDSCTFKKQNEVKPRNTDPKSGRDFSRYDWDDIYQCPNGQWLSGFTCLTHECQEKVIWCSERTCEPDYDDVYYTPWLGKYADYSCPEGYYAIAIDEWKYKVNTEDHSDHLDRLKCAAKCSRSSCRPKDGTEGASEWFSDEDDGQFRTTNLVVGAEWDHRFCDSMRIHHVVDEKCYHVASWDPREYLSEEVNFNGYVAGRKRQIHNVRTCPNDRWLAGWACYDEKCDNKEIFCQDRACKPDPYVHQFSSMFSEET